VHWKKTNREKGLITKSQRVLALASSSHLPVPASPIGERQAGLPLATRHFLFSNREPIELEHDLSYSKQRESSRSNREETTILQTRFLPLDHHLAMTSRFPAVPA
jgi:hypothetical protein